MRTPRRLLSGSTLGALIAVGALADPAAADSSAPHPVPASATEVPLTLAPDADPVPEHESVDAPHRSIRDDAAPFSLDAPDVVLTATSETSGFAVAGVVWDDTGDADVSSVELRTLSDGTWSPWESVEPEESEKDVPSSADASLAGTDPIVIGDVDQVEVRLVADAEPSNARLAVIDPGTSAADSAVPEASEAGDFPPILPRSAWGADESIMTWTPQPATVSGAVIHHTAGTNDYTPEQVPAILRGIYTFHAQTNDWGDIGYNFLIDKFGRAWEGRAGGITNATVGAHAYGFNSVTTGISVMGNYTTAAISDPAWDTLVDVTAWKLSERGVDVNGTMVVNGTTYPALVGHRDVGVTECPGDQLYERLGELRDAVSERQAHYDATPEVAPEPETSPEPQPETTPEPEPSPEPTPDVTPEPEPSPEASPAPGVTPGPEVTPEPEVAPEPDGDGDPVVEGPVVDGPDVEGPSVEPGLDGPGADGPGTDGDRDVPPPAGDGSLGGVTPISSVDRAPDTARGPRPPGQLAATGTVVATSVGLMVLALGSGVALLHRARASVD